MFWEEANTKQAITKSEKVVDVSYKVNCKQLPASHANELTQALYALLPWLKDESAVAIHQIYGPASGNGWERPADGELLQLSRRTRMQLRLPVKRINDAKSLTGEILDIAGYSLSVGDMSVKPVTPFSTLFARYVVMPDDYNEQIFLQWVAQQLKQCDIPAKKMLCGMSHRLQVGGDSLETRSLMIADLDQAASVLLQEIGLGSARHYGCGIFLPHKGIKAVIESDNK